MTFIDPLPRTEFLFGLVDDTKLCVWGGLNREMTSFFYDGEPSPIKEVTRSVLTYLPWQEKWLEAKSLKGSLPLCFRNGASASSGRFLYIYGGCGGKDDDYSSYVYQLDTSTWEWALLAGEESASSNASKDIPVE